MRLTKLVNNLGSSPLEVRLRPTNLAGPKFKMQANGSLPVNGWYHFGQRKLVTCFFLF